MNNLSRQGKYRIVWNTESWNWSKENERKIINDFSRKYNIPKDRIKVEPNIKVVDELGNEISVKTEVIDNIHDPNFQKKLFQDYIKINNIENINFEQINEIDNEINQSIDYNQYDKFNKISIKWIEVKNFMSFGPEITRLDLTELNGLVLITGQPANQAGKSVLTGDAIRYLLYGKTNRTNSQDKIFNRFLPKETEVIVRGCIAINKDEYVIERKLTRPAKRTKSSKASGMVKYFKVIDKFWDPEQPLIDYDPETFDNQSGDMRMTNKIIKDSLMREEDYNLITTANSKTLDGLIDTGESGLSKLFSRWIGLSVLEDKEVLAKELYKEKSKLFLCNQYSKDHLQETNIELTNYIEKFQLTISDLNEKLIKQNTTIEEFTKSKDVLLSSKGTVDEKLVKLDFETQEKRRENIIEQGKNLRSIEKEYLEKVNELKDVVITVDKKIIEDNRRIISETNLRYHNNIGDTNEKYNKDISDIKFKYNTYITNDKKEANDTILPLVEEIATIKTTINALKEENKKLDGSRICPTCNRAYDNDVIENINKTIQKNKITIQSLIEKGVEKNTLKEKTEKDSAETVEKLERELATRVEEMEKDQKRKVEKLQKEQKETIEKLEKENQLLIDKLDLETKQIEERNRWELKLSQTRVEIEKSLGQYKEVNQLIKDYEKNKEIIQKNMEISLFIENHNIRIKTEMEIKESLIKDITQHSNNITNWEKQIESNNDIIGKLYVENIYIIHFQLLIKLLGKDGVKKIILKNLVPLINSGLNNLLSELVDFSISMDIDEKSNLTFNILKDTEDGEDIGDLRSASGFERTMASLALRSTLAKYGAIPLIDITVFDEITACTSEQNFPLLYELFKRIENQYKIVFVISHSQDFNQYFENVITIVKENNISRIK